MIFLPRTAGEGDRLPKSRWWRGRAARMASLQPPIFLRNGMLSRGCDAWRVACPLPHALFVAWALAPFHGGGKSRKRLYPAGDGRGDWAEALSVTSPGVFTW